MKNTEKSFRIVETTGWQLHKQIHTWSPPTDTFETETCYVVRVEIAGMLHQNFSIQIEDNMLVISGVRHDTKERRAFHQMELRFGEFSTFTPIPGPVNLDESSAEYNDGLLTVYLPKIIPG